ncbi:Di-sulfide bridge nucleocytoplasmic transport domain-containing protein [Paraphaeosphaeria minitans]|uniref:Di-sulfide bridge nucleocytoplasmic transport domain-containing protein n=1 Tax=Paraphaeosphaeria minitans TaxID=565426 RepID=A0A9P6GQK7_9PLEO|nr:Di-sulfide bridge nucleocytoplasmic transport domain-containing protein [Paraphaeosphaeria minitans]
MPGYRDRESIVPMDFEYDNRVGPVDSQSPFIAHAAKKRKLVSFASSHPQSEEQVQKLNEGPPFGQPAAGTHSVFDSPSKSTFATPNHPKLSDPHGQRFLFSQTTQKALPQTPQNKNVWDLRTPQSMVDSSGGETPIHDTPAHDSDSATPDTQLALTMGGLTHGERKSPSKRSSFFKSLPWNKSPSKEKSSREKPYSKKVENRVLKRRLKSRTRQHDYDSEAESPTKNIQQAAPAIGFAAKIPGALAWVEAHPNLPNVLSYYMQFFVNAALGLFFLWIVYVVYSAVMADIDNEAQSKVRDIMHEIAVCSSEFERNGCDKPVPALESLCQNWKRCKERDAYQVARASVGARTFAMIFNSFVEEFSYKSMLFTAIILFGSLNLSNWAFGFWRQKAQPHPQHEYPPVPQTPQRYPSGGYVVDNNSWHTPAPYMTPYGNMEQRPMLQHAQSMPAALPSAEEDTLRSPSKRAVRR